MRKGKYFMYVVDRYLIDTIIGKLQHIGRYLAT